MILKVATLADFVDEVESGVVRLEITQDERVISTKNSNLNVRSRIESPGTVHRQVMYLHLMAMVNGDLVWLCHGRASEYIPTSPNQHGDLQPVFLDLHKMVQEYLEGLGFFEIKHGIYGVGEEAPLLGTFEIAEWDEDAFCYRGIDS